MHADPVDGTRAVREKRLDLLKESQIRSWLSNESGRQKMKDWQQIFDSYRDS